MNAGAWGRCSRLMVTIALLAIAGLVIVTMGGCGSGDSGTADPGATLDVSTASEPTGSSADGQGAQLAEEILTTFDELVAEVAALAQDKPEQAVLKPQLEQLYESYVPTMNTLNREYLALRDSDIAQFGECNTYLGDYRGQHVTDKDSVLSAALLYYNLELGDQEIVSLLSDRPVELLEIAVAQN